MRSSHLRRRNFGSVKCLRGTRLSVSVASAWMANPGVAEPVDQRVTHGDRRGRRSGVGGELVAVKGEGQRALRRASPQWLCSRGRPCASSKRKRRPVVVRVYTSETKSLIPGLLGRSVARTGEDAVEEAAGRSEAHRTKTPVQTPAALRQGEHSPVCCPRSSSPRSGSPCRRHCAATHFERRTMRVLWEAMKTGPACRAAKDRPSWR